MKIMASGPITSWQIDGKTVETVSDFIFLRYKVTADSECSREIKRCLLLGRKAMTNLHSLLKSKDNTLTTKVHLVKSVFSSSHVWMWELDYKQSWVLNNWCFWTVLLEKTLESLGMQWDQSSQSSRKSGLNNCWTDWYWKLKRQCFGHLIWRIGLKRPWCCERLKAGG